MNRSINRADCDHRSRCLAHILNGLHVVCKPIPTSKLFRQAVCAYVLRAIDGNQVRARLRFLIKIGDVRCSPKPSRVDRRTYLYMNRAEHCLWRGRLCSMFLWWTRAVCISQLGYGPAHLRGKSLGTLVRASLNAIARQRRARHG